MALPPQSLVMLGLALQLSLESSSLISSFPFSYTHILSSPIIHHQGLLAPPSCYTGVWRWRGPSQATGASGLTIWFPPDCCFHSSTSAVQSPTSWSSALIKYKLAHDTLQLEPFAGFPPHQSELRTPFHGP